MAAKDRARGKALERYVASLFGWRRRTNGEHGGFDDCVEMEGGLTPISIEAKAYATIQLRQAWVDQAIRNANGRPWAIIQRPKGSRIVLATIPLTFLYQLYTNHHQEATDEAGGDT